MHALIFGQYNLVVQSVVLMDVRLGMYYMYGHTNEDIETEFIVQI